MKSVDSQFRVNQDSLFDITPISLWLEDFSAVYDLMTGWRDQGVTNIRAFLSDHPQRIDDFFARIRVLTVNQRTLDLYKAKDLAALLAACDRIFDVRDNSTAIAEIEQLWLGANAYRTETINYTLSGDPLYIRLNVNRLADAERPWDRMLVAVEDLTEQTIAQAKLEYLSTHDPLTSLYNRTFHESRVLERNLAGPFPLGVLVADVNGLKSVNDLRGHSAGDQLLRRAADVLRDALGHEQQIARIGGDEFAALLPNHDAARMTAVVRAIAARLDLEAPAQDAMPLSLSIGVDVCKHSGELHAALRESDRKMYEAKRLHYGGADGGRHRN